MTAAAAEIERAHNEGDGAGVLAAFCEEHSEALLAEESSQSFTAGTETLSETSETSIEVGEEKSDGTWEAEQTPTPRGGAGGEAITDTVTLEKEGGAWCLLPPGAAPE